MTRRRLRNIRPKALFGEEGAAILAAAGISAAATTAGAALSAKASKDAAKQQADATIAQAQKQAEALSRQNEVQKENIVKQQDFVKEQYEKNRDIARDTQMLLQQQMGLENTNARLEASKIKVKFGGNANKRLRSMPTFPLRGGLNIPFKVTDGGDTKFIGKTPEGYDLYELHGNDHEHYHKAQGGKNKTGVGIKFLHDNGIVNTIEGEGNQNTNQGEYMLTMPNDALFISKHNIRGFNPAKAINRGMHPLLAYQLQEQAKGKGSRPVGKMLVGGDLSTNMLMGSITPNTDYSYDNMIPTVVENTFIDNNKKLKYGGRTKAITGTRSGNSFTVGKGDTMWGIAAQYGGGGKNWRQLYKLNKGVNPNRMRIGSTLTLPNGWGVKGAIGSYQLPSLIDDASNFGGTSFDNSFMKGDILNDYNSQIEGSQPSAATVDNTGGQTGTSGTAKKGGFWSSPLGTQTLAAGISALGGLAGGLISTAGNRRAASIMADAQQRGADIMSDAYGKLTGISPDIISAEDFRATHFMPAIHTARVNINPQLEDINRGLRRTMRYAQDNGISSAAKNKRLMDMIDLAGQRKSELYAKQSNLEEENRNRTAQLITEAAAKNAELDVQANKDYTGARLEIAKYNNDINNQKILGAAGVQADAATNGANIIGGAAATNGGIWGQTLSTGLQGFSNVLNDMVSRKQSIDMVMLGAGTGAKVEYLSANGTPAEKAAYRTRLEQVLPKLSGREKEIYERYIAMLS